MDSKRESREDETVLPTNHPFLDHDFHDTELGNDEDDLQQQPPYRPQSWARKNRLALLFHGFMISSYIALGLSYWKGGPLRNRICGTSTMLFSELALIARLRDPVADDYGGLCSSDTRPCGKKNHSYS